MEEMGGREHLRASLILFLPNLMDLSYAHNTLVSFTCNAVCADGSDDARHRMRLRRWCISMAWMSCLPGALERESSSTFDCAPYSSTGTCTRMSACTVCFTTRRTSVGRCTSRLEMAATGKDWIPSIYGASNKNSSLCLCWCMDGRRNVSTHHL